MIWLSHAWLVKLLIDLCACSLSGVKLWSFVAIVDISVAHFLCSQSYLWTWQHQEAKVSGNSFRVCRELNNKSTPLLPLPSSLSPSFPSLSLSPSLPFSLPLSLSSVAYLCSQFWDGSLFFSFPLVRFAFWSEYINHSQFMLWCMISALSLSLLLSLPLPPSSLPPFLPPFSSCSKYESLKVNTTLFFMVGGAIVAAM